jgi:hypothetical protein
LADYNLTGLSSRSFEHLVQSLAAAVVGPGVVVFGDGPDGAREATYEGALSYGQKNWAGYLVFQAKFLQKPSGTRTDGAWLIQQLNNELPNFLEKKRRLRKPEHYVVATNVSLSAVSGRGTKDNVSKLLRDYAPKVGYKDFDIWDSDKIRVFLDQYRDIATTYSAWITPGDVLRKLIDTIEGATPGFDETLATFLKKELLSSQYANLEQAGHTTESQIPLSGVFIDLPVSDKQLYEPDDAARGFTAEIIQAAKDVFRLDQNKARDAGDRKLGRYVLVGGPGHGKTTVGQYICQLFRATILANRDRIPAEVQSALALINDQSGLDRVDLPTTRRFPVQIVLSEFAKTIASEEGPKSVLAYIAARIARRTDQQIDPGLLKKWLGACPWLIVLDGLDEVPSSSNRPDVLRAVEEFWVDASESAADLLVIATTRPQDYSFEFSPKFYDHRYLAPLSPGTALKYGSRLVEVRYGGMLIDVGKCLCALNELREKMLQLG